MSPITIVVFASIFGGMIALAVYALYAYNRDNSPSSPKVQAQMAEAVRIRREALLSRWPAEDVNRIMNGTIWRGASMDQVFEALGPPGRVDEAALKTKMKHTWRYGPALSVIFEDGVVSGWRGRSA